MKNRLPNIAVITGGYSGEFEISIKSVSAIMEEIDKSKFNTFVVSITYEKWICIHPNGEFPIDKNDFSITINNKKLIFDLAFIMIHGTPGEDGKLQSYFDMLNIPYTCCSATVSAITFNKNLCNTIIKASEIVGVSVPNSFHISASIKYDLKEIAKFIGFPCFVKPNSGGSSIGASKIYSLDQLQKAIDKAFMEDNEILIEEFIEGKEITCGVIRSKGELISFPLTEIISKNDFFDYEAKYTPGVSEEITPARIDEVTANNIRKISEYCYCILGCKGIVRFDYILNPT